MKAGLLDEAKRILTHEAQAIEKAAALLGDEFVGAVETIVQKKSCLIVSGMGKSGHIARKIVATLNSTGTRAHFLHPAEAIHGDLGYVNRNDVALLISNSGETDELLQIVPFFKKQAKSELSVSQQG